MMATQEVLKEFGYWLDAQPETTAKQWVRENPPTDEDAERAVMIFQLTMDLAA